MDGFFDGTNYHVFWVGTDGLIYEAYGSNINSGTWTVHAIGQGALN